MTDPIEVNVAGRLMLLLTRLGTLDNRSLSIYQSAVCEAVRAHIAAGDRDPASGIEGALEHELALLEAALVQRASPSPPAPQAAITPPAESRDVPPDTGVASVEPGDAVHVARHARAPSGYVPPVKSMEQKLQDARKPLQALLSDDCVRVGLIDANEAKQLIFGMTGKTGEQAEREIVEQLRQTLQDQVRAFIRKSKGGPWADPRTQADLRQDIHAAKTVRGILMLARQVLKEYQTWVKEHQRGGILGLFSPRRHNGGS